MRVEHDGQLRAGGVEGRRRRATRPGTTTSSRTRGSRSRTVRTGASTRSASSRRRRAGRVVGAGGRGRGRTTRRTRRRPTGRSRSSSPVRPDGPTGSPVRPGAPRRLPLAGFPGDADFLALPMGSFPWEAPVLLHHLVNRHPHPTAQGTSLRASSGHMFAARRACSSTRGSTSSDGRRRTARRVAPLVAGRAPRATGPRTARGRRSGSSQRADATLHPPPRCTATSSANTCMVLATNRAVPSGCAHAPRPTTSRRIRSTSSTSRGSRSRRASRCSGVGHPRQPVDARAALAGDLVRRGTTRRRRSPRARSGPGRGRRPRRRRRTAPYARQRRARQPGRVDRVPGHPGAVVAADQHRLRGVRPSAGRGQQRAQRGAERRPRRRPGVATAPLTVARNVPGSSAVPTARNQGRRSGPAARCARASRRCAPASGGAARRARRPARSGPRAPPALPLSGVDDRGLLAGDEAVLDLGDLDPQPLPAQRDLLAQVPGQVGAGGDQVAPRWRRRPGR